VVRHEGHRGVCRVIRSFWVPWARDLAETIEHEFETDFAEYGADIKVLPIRISYLSQVGEGIQLSLIPRDPKRWPWWGDFESDVEVRRRQRLTRAWTDFLGAADVEEWLRRQVQSYLKRLVAAGRIEE
jgi:hypothetical protein